MSREKVLKIVQASIHLPGFKKVNIAPKSSSMKKIVLEKKKFKIYIAEEILKNLLFFVDDNIMSKSTVGCLKKTFLKSCPTPLCSHFVIV
jgi:hypothetical protein